MNTVRSAVLVSIALSVLLADPGHAQARPVELGLDGALLVPAIIKLGVIAPAAHMLGCSASQVLGQSIEQEVCPIGPLDQVEQEVLQPAQAPGGLEQLAAQGGFAPSQGGAENRGPARERIGGRHKR